MRGLRDVSGSMDYSYLNATSGSTRVASRAGARRILSNRSAVVDRILSFDANGDDRIAHDELPERMEGLVGRGDRNQDGFLISDEIVVLVDSPAAVSRLPRTSIVRRPGGLKDAIADLKLPASTHNRALAIVKVPRNVHAPTGVDLDAEMRELLDDEDYENFVAAYARLRRTSGVIGGIVGGVPRNPASPR